MRSECRARQTFLRRLRAAGAGIFGGPGRGRCCGRGSFRRGSGLFCARVAELAGVCGTIEYRVCRILAAADAAIIDGIVVSIPLMPVFFLIFIDIFRHAQDLQGRQDPAAFLAIMGPKIGLILFVSAIVSWLYWALCESSAWQATLGKKALGIIVTDLEGRRISFGRASGRFWAGRA